MNYKERKQYVLEHKDKYIKQNKIYAKELRRFAISEWEKNFNMKYTPEKEEELYSTYFNDEERKTRKTISERYKKDLEDAKDIKNVLKSGTIMRTKEFHHKEKVGKIDIKKYLESIRYDMYKENLIILYIKNNKIISEDFIEGKIDRVHPTKKQWSIVFVQAVNLNANVYIVHNHPFDFSARPSKADIKLGRNLKRSLNKINRDLLDWGVVTKCDYYSNKQQKRKERP